MRKKGIWTVLILLMAVSSQFLLSCDNEHPPTPPDPNWTYNPQPYIPPAELAGRFPPMPVNPANPMTLQGIKLGRHLFYDPILSADSTLSCASCHAPEWGFTDHGLALSTNLDGPTQRNSMPLFNLAWHPRFFWDYRASTLEDAVLDALINEQHFDAVVSPGELKQHQHYRKWYYEAFADTTLTQDYTVKALAQFLKSMISYQSKYDKVLAGQEQFSTLEQYAVDSIFLTTKGDCFHCHQTVPSALTSTFAPRNNGLQFAPDPSYYTDIGYGIVNPNNTSWYGRFKVPELRNLIFTPPYMHDGRIPDLDSLINFYSTGVHLSLSENYNIDPNMAADFEGNFNQYQKDALKAMFAAMVDSAFINDTAYQNPW